jgi:hypothetical protein
MYFLQHKRTQSKFRDNSMLSALLKLSESLCGNYFSVLYFLKFVRLNLPNLSELSNPWLFSGSVSARIRVWLLFSFVVCFGGLIAAVWIGCVIWFVNPFPAPGTVYPGIALIVQNGLIFTGYVSYLKVAFSTFF